MTDGESPKTSPASPWRRRVSVAVVSLVAVLAVSETVSALVAPLRAPKTADWQAVEAIVRAQFRPGDLIVAAPAWSDQVMRQYLGDLVPLKVAGRLDAGRYGRIWQISQRGAIAPEVAGARMTDQANHGPLHVDLYQRPAEKLVYDFVDQWSKARVARKEPGRGEIPCPRALDRHQCPDLGFNFVKPRVLEMDATLHRGLLAQPVGGATVVVEWAGVPLGHTLVVGAGLHDAWWRRGALGTVIINTFVDGKKLGQDEATNRSAWHVTRLDTSVWAGRTGTVRFEISSAKPAARMFGFAAEARD